MENIILQIIKKCFKFDKNMNFTDMTKVVYENSSIFASELIKFTLEEIDQQIQLSKERKRAWDIIRIDKRTIKTIIGTVTYKRRYYRNKNTKKYAYLLDESIGIIKYKRLGIILESKILEFANLLSFENAGKLTTDFNEVSKQTVKNIVGKYAEKEEQ